MRGKDIIEIKIAGIIGITPAHAGKRVALLKLGTYKEDHPRTCGEKETSEIENFLLTRITPAHAGKRSMCFDLILLK